MAFKIGFSAEHSGNEPRVTYTQQQEQASPRKSLAQVYFAERNMTLTYYNDLFDLHCGDIVYVDGKLEGMQGRVTDVNYTFKIKVSDYKRVISVADTRVRGRFFMAGSHFITFDCDALPSSKAVTWFKAPTDGEEYVSGSDGSSFNLDNLSGMNVDMSTAERGRNYYVNERVAYISVDGAKGYAVVEGSKAYEVEFEYRGGEISRLTCSCFCGCNCKHEFAAMLKLKEMLERIEKNYAEEFERTGYFAAINKCKLFAFAIDGKDNGEFTL